jgi:hypothetical protein
MMNLEQAKEILRQSTSGVYFYEGNGIWFDENDASNMLPTLGIDGEMTAEQIQALGIVVAAEGLNFSLAKVPA